MSISTQPTFSDGKTLLLARIAQSLWISGGFSPPFSTGQPVISGTLTSGQLLGTTNGTWSFSPSSYAYQWIRRDSGGLNPVNIGGATSATYTLTGADVGNTIQVKITATNANGSAIAYSAVTSVIQAGASFQSGTNAQKLSGAWSVGQEFHVTDGFVLASAASDNGFYYADGGTANGRATYTSPSAPSGGQIIWDGAKWTNGNALNLGNGLNPWTSPQAPATLAHPAVQTLAEPSTAQGGVFVSGGTQDGVYANAAFNDKQTFRLLGDSSHSVEWLQTDPPAWWVKDNDDNFYYYSLSDVATPDLAGSDKFVMAVSGVAYSKRGTFNGKSYYTKIGSTTSTSLNAIFWSSATWHITNAIGVDLDTSTSAVATPDLATFLLGTVVTNTAWLNASGDTPAAITVASVLQGELDAGVTAAGAGTSVLNGTYTNQGTAFAGNRQLIKLGGSNGEKFLPDESVGYQIKNDDDIQYGSEANHANPWETVTWHEEAGTPPVPTVTRNNVASEQNWDNV